MSPGIEAEVAAARADPRRAFGPFLVLSEIGKGGMGVVYRAWDDRLRRVVAVKTLLAADETALQRFEREAQALARLRHPGVVAVHGAGSVGGRPYLAMDFVEGTPLSKLLGRGATTKLPLTRALEVIRDIALALHAAHEQGIVHRDLKPANVIVEPSGRAVVLDFGIARVHGSDSKVTRTGATLGTPAYMAPEQADDAGGAADARTDVYALGATLYHVLTGGPPFEGPSEIAVITALLTREPVPPSLVNPRSAGDLETICLRCLEKDPARRYPTARDVALEIDRYLSGEPIEARPIGTFERRLRWARRNKLVTGLALLAGTALAGLVALATSTWIARARAEENKILAERAEAAANARKLAEERRAGREKTAAVFAERAARSLEAGRHRSATLQAAESIACVESQRARTLYLAARQGPHGRPTLFVKPGPSRALFVKISPDGTLLALARGDGTILLRSLPGGEDLGTLGPIPDLGGIGWRPGRTDRHELLVAAGDTASIWRESSRKLEPLAKLPQGMPSCSWFPDGESLITCGGKSVSVCDLSRGAWRTVAEVDMGVYGVAPRPGGDLVAVWGTRYKLALVGLDGRPFETIQGPFQGSVSYAAWTPDGSRFLTASDRRVRIWEIAANRVYELKSLPGLGLDVWGFEWSPSGHRVMFATEDGLVRIWDFRTERASILEMEPFSHVSSLAWSPDERLVAIAAEDGSVTLADPNGSKEVEFLGSATHVHSIAWSRDRKLAATGRSGFLSLGTSDDRSFPLHQWGFSLSWNPPGDRIAVAVAGFPGHVRAFDATQPGSAPIFERRGSSWATRVSWSNDGKWIAGAWGTPFGPRGSFELSIDDPLSGASRKPIPQDTIVNGLGWAKDGSLAAGSADGFVRFYDPETLAETRRLDLKAPVAALACSPDGKVVAVAVRNEVRLFDAATLAPRGNISSHERDVLAIAFDATSGRIATIGRDRTLRVHSPVPKLELLQTIELRGAAASVAFHPDGKKVGVCFEDLVGGIEVWPLEDALSRTPPDRILEEAVRETGLPVDGEIEKVLREDKKSP